MSTAIINQLQELKPNSNKLLKKSTIDGFSGYLSSSGNNPLLLARKKMIANANWTTVATNGIESLTQAKNKQSIRKIMTLSVGQDSNFTYRLNTALLGGESYPILTWFLGAALGIASGGAGLLFAAATTAIDAGKTSRRVLARTGDEIWQVEEIGKVSEGGKFKAIHVNSYFIADPYRGHALGKGWLIHEERSELTLE